MSSDKIDEADRGSHPSAYHPSPALVTSDSKPPPAAPVSEQPHPGAVEADKSDATDGPRSYCLLSLCMTLLCCCCCMLPSLLCTIPAMILSKYAKKTGDPVLTKRYTNAALALNILAVVTWMVVIILIAVIVPITVRGKHHHAFAGNDADFNHTNGTLG